MNNACPTLFDTEIVDSLIAYVETRPPGEEHYLQLKCCPMSSVLIVVGEDRNMTRMEYVGTLEEVDYPLDKYKTILIGYEWYEENLRSTTTH
jgi:hypothetical protein